MTEEVGKNSRRCSLGVGWFVAAMLVGCGEATEPTGGEIMPPAVVNQSRVPLDFADATERVLPTIEDAASARLLLSELERLSAAFDAYNDKLALASLGRARELLLGTEMHPASKTVVTRALDAAEAIITKQPNEKEL